MNAPHNNQNLNLFWFRRDLRVNDNHGLYKALIAGPTICCFIWDKEILSQLGNDNPRVKFIEESILTLKTTLNQYNSDLQICYGNTDSEIIKLIQQHNISNIYVNEDYEPETIKRDEKIAAILQKKQISFNLFKDQLIFAKKEILTQQHNPYTVFSAYKNSWYQKFAATKLAYYPSEQFLHNLVQTKFFNPNLDFLKSFSKISPLNGGEYEANERLLNFINNDNLKNYKITRDYPALNSSSYLGVDLRFGTISIRKLVQIAEAQASSGSEIWLNELIWREFFSQILYNFPSVVKQSFRKEYQQLKYLNQNSHWQAWCQGKTGVPIVDAGMRQLNQTGFMHNRVRMICASFLCKDLLISWQWGERYFAQKLLDYDLASNNGNWQWCSSTGCDAQPFFRIFNPYLQSEKFDPEGQYIRKYLPELKQLNNKEIHKPSQVSLEKLINYPKPIVNHAIQVKLAKIMFLDAKKENTNASVK